MARYVLKRLLMMVVVVLGISFIVFVIMNLTPGNAAQMILGQSARPEQVAELEAELGLDQPFLIRYFRYILERCFAAAISVKSYQTQSARCSNEIHDPISRLRCKSGDSWQCLSRRLSACRSA